MTTIISKPESKRDKARGNITHSSLEQDCGIPHIALMNSSYILLILARIVGKRNFIFH